MVFLTLLGIPLFLVTILFIFGKKRISLAEFLIQIAVQAAIAGASVGIIYHMDTSDVEVWNGRVADKKRERVSCSHSYQCNCYTTCSGSGKTRSCTRHCSTCYEHSYDVDWAVYTTLKERIEIDRINRQGTNEPPRWTQVKIGEPTSSRHGYTNYIKAAPDSLFRRQGLTEDVKQQVYPNKVYDYYRLDRVTGNYGLSMPDLAEWNRSLSELNADLGHSKQVNVIVMLVNDKPSSFAEEMEQLWLGGKKNDVVLIANVDKTTKEITWTYVMAWTDATYFKVHLRDDVLGIKTLDREALFGALRSNINELYIRKPMEDFEYLAASITPTATQWMVSMVIGLLAALGLSFVFWNNDNIKFAFEEEQQRRRYY